MKFGHGEQAFMVGFYRKFPTIPRWDVAGYKVALSDFMSRYKSDATVFFFVNYSTICFFHTGSPRRPVPYSLQDILSSLDPFFRADGSINSKAYRKFLKLLSSCVEEHYLAASLSNRIMEDVIDLGLAVSEPHPRRPVVPSIDVTDRMLSEQLRRMSLDNAFPVSRFLPAFQDEIFELNAAGVRSEEVAKIISDLSGRSVSKHQVLRLLSARDDFVEENRKRRNLAAITYERSVSAAPFSKRELAIQSTFSSRRLDKRSFLRSPVEKEKGAPGQ